MIKADHKRWAHLLFDPYITWQLKKNFTNFFLANDFSKPGSNEKLLLTPNHISWWDGFFINHIVQKILDRQIYLMMLEEQLSKYSFFKNVGAYSIVQENNKDILESFNYTLKLMADPSNVCIIYPQGVIEAIDKRPLDIKKGIQFLSKLSDYKFDIVPVAFRIQYYENKNPALICRFGKTTSSENILKDWKEYENSFYDNLDKLAESAFKRDFVRDIFHG